METCSFQFIGILEPGEGKVLYFYSTKLNHDIFFEIQEDNLQIQTTKVTLEKKKNFFVKVLYGTPNSSICSFLNIWNQYLTHLNIKHPSKHLVCGDCLILIYLLITKTANDYIVYHNVLTFI